MRLLYAIPLVGLLLACGGDPAPTTPPECEEIGSACHEAGETDAEAEECHHNAHDVWTRDECIANRASCLAICEMPDAGPNDAGGEH
jgi:hypothetical protein